MQLDVWSDIVCPWCYLNKRRFEAALATFEHRDEVTIRWHSFELDPTTPQHTEGTINEMLAEKFGITTDRAAAMNEQMAALAAKDGLEYHFDHMHPANTFDAHRLTHLAASHGWQDAMEERLMHAYFNEGLAISEPDVLVSLYAEIGGDAEEARETLQSNAFADEVRADEQEAMAIGISGVPFMVIDEQYGLSGAQPVETYTKAFNTVWEKSHPAPKVEMLGTKGDGLCTDDACDVVS